MTPEQEAALIERMAKAISDGDVNWRDWVEEARAALSIAKPIIRDEALEEVERHFEDAEWVSAVARIRALRSKGQKP